MLTKMCRDCVHYEVCAHKVDTDADMDGVCEHFKDRSLFGFEPIGGSDFDRLIDSLELCAGVGSAADCKKCPYFGRNGNCAGQLKKEAREKLISYKAELAGAYKRIAVLTPDAGAEGWISAHEAPPEDEDVLIYAYSNRRDTGIVSTGWWTSYAGWQLTGKRDPSEWIVTHWMPMPPVPENKGRM